MICNFSPIAFKIFDFSVYWYSLAYIIGIFIATKLTKFFSQKTKQSFYTKIDDYISYAILGIVLGGRLGYVLFYDFNYYMQNPTEIIKIWHGGMSFFGALLGVISLSYLFCLKHKINFLRFMDMWSISTPIGLFFGRIANFINGELLGKESTVPWNVVFTDGIHRHPSQIYEALSEGLLMFFIMLFFFHKGAYKKEGQLCGIFGLGYGIFRFICEFFREPDSSFSWNLYISTGLNLNQYMSFILISIAIFLIHRSKKKIYV